MADIGGPKPLGGGGLTSTYYVATTGSSGGTGALADPWDLATAILPGQVRAGSTIYLRGGTYTGNFDVKLNGKADKMTTIRSYPGERVIIDGGLTVSGDYIRVMGSDA